MAQLFISYSRKDTDFARKLADRFEAEKFDAWVDWQDIPPSVDWLAEVKRGVEETDVFLFLVSPDSISSNVCADEVNHAVANGKRIIPIVTREVDAKLVPATISHLNWIFFSRPQDLFEESFEMAMLAIHMDYEWVQVHRRLQIRALEWERAQREPSLLLRGRDLQDAEAQLTVNGAKDPAVTDLQKEYVSSSRTVEDKSLEEERAKEQQLQLEKKMGSRLRRLTFLLLGVFTVAFIALFFWLNQITNDLALNSIKNQMLALVETSVCFINGDDYYSFLGNYSGATDALYASNYYSNMDFFMHDVINTNQNIDTHIVLYTITQGATPQDVLVIASTEEDIDYKTTVYSGDISPALIEGLNKTSADMTVIQDGADSWVSACSPILDSDGQSVGALCADFSAQLLKDTREKVTTTLGIAFLAVYPAMILLVIFSTRTISKRLEARAAAN